MLGLDRLDLEVERDQAEHQCLEILHQVVENPQTLGVSRFGDIDERSDLCRLKADVLTANLDLKLLSTIFVFLWPLSIIFPVGSVSAVAIESRSTGIVSAYLRISLLLMMRLISSMTRELTHTVLMARVSAAWNQYWRNRVGGTHSLFGSGCHFGNWNCLHNAQPHCDHRQQHESRILSG